jgi:hypothetical protein
MHRTPFSGFRIGAVVAVLAFLLAGCSSLTSALSSAFAPAPAPAAAPAPNAAPQDQKSSPSGSEAGKGAAYQYQFTSFYGSMWTMGWMGYKDSSYKLGQGTVWLFSGSSGDPVTFERALLRINQDSTQWWRFKLDTKKDSILYEFLVGTDGKAQKVRYKDPDTGAVAEFVPSDSGAPAAGQTPGLAEMAKYKVDRQTVKVAAGSFPSDHYLYKDERGSGTAETWVSSSVPGSIIKSVFTSSKDKRTSTVELVQIESGVTTVLGSF